MTVEDDVLKKVTPTIDQKTKVLAIFDEVKEKILKKAMELGIEVEPILVGSVAKDTALSLMDIDIFIMFHASTSIDDLQKYGLMLGESIVKGERRYAQHPYTHGNYKGFVLDIVPCYRIESPSQKMTAVDRTPFHTKYVIEHLGENRKSDVRLLKQFLKGIKAYGADAKTQGFSGYLCEALVIKFGSFIKVLEASSSWHRGTYIRVEMKESPQFADPFIVIDPIDPTRNAAAAVSLDNLSLFIHAADEYLKNNKIEFFFPNKLKQIDIKKITKILDDRGTDLLAVTIERPKIVDDILFSQVKKCEKAIVQLCEQFEFKVCSSKYFVDDENIWFIYEFEVYSLPKISVHLGPPIWNANSKEFLTKWKEERKFAGPYIQGDRWAVDIYREYATADDLVKNNLLHAGLGKDLSQFVTDGKYKIIDRKSLLIKENAEKLSDFFDKTFPWEK